MAEKQAAKPVQASKIVINTPKPTGEKAATALPPKDVVAGMRADVAKMGRFSR